jgi:hypothetical protein
VDVLDWVKKRMDDPAAPQKAGPAATDAPPNLRGANPVSALVELGTRLEAATGAGADPKARSTALAAIQNASAVHVAALVTQYLNNAAGTQAAREAGWKSLVGFQFRLTQALCASAGAQLTPESAVRALSACRILAKLHLMHYATVPGRLWHVAYNLHAGAEKGGFATTPMHAQSDPRTMTTVEQELLRLLMLQVSAPDMLAPEEIELADRIVERLGAEFTLRQPGVADNPFCFEPGSEHAPRPAKGQQPAGTARYFGAGIGYGSLERIGRQPNGARPEDFKPFGKDIAPSAQLNTVQHLLAFWRADSPHAPPAHEPATGRVQVVHGYGEVWRDLSLTRHGGELSLAATSPNVPRPAESWQLRGAGAGELAAEVAQDSRSWVKCGALVGLSLRDGAEHWVGIIRRLHARPDGGLQANIAVLSRAPQARTLRRVLKTGEDRPFTEAASKQFGMSSVRALMLAHDANAGQPAHFVLPPESWTGGRLFELEKDSELHYLRGLQVVRRGDDYVLATFEEVPAPG